MREDTQQDGLSRRELLRLLGTGVLAALAPGMMLGQAQGAGKTAGDGFERAAGPGVIFVVGDGMPLGVVRAMHEIRTGVFGRADSNLYARLRDPKSSVGYMATASLSSIVTDSAPASAAWATGVKTVNHSLSVLPDGRPLTTIFELVKPRGVATGLVTTTRVTHATPAAWISHQPDRDSEDAIASEMLAFNPDVLLGGGSTHFDAKKRKDGLDLLAGFAKAGYDTVTDRASLLAAPTHARPLVGLFSPSHIAYHVDRLNDSALSSQPSLPEMTAAALKRLAKNPDGFLLQVEAGRIDHASHSNDAWSAIMDTIELDDTLGVIDAFLKVNPRTLVIVTSDHGNSGWGVNGTGPEYNDATSALRSYRAGKASFEATIKRMKDKSVGEIQQLVAEMSGFPINLDEARLIHESMQPGYKPFPGDFIYQPDATIGKILAHSAYPSKGAPSLRRGNVGFTSCNHTAEDQLLLAYGHQAKELGLDRLVDNTALFDVMCRAFGVTHKNPTMSLAQARPLILAKVKGVGMFRRHIV
ncbi:MAG: alkaline phosphatase [Humidesulfovibrio sp.]|jgi:alkaline phosphatase|uniref:alkaline phosphatase n=1 Tax=Humidesulfovibrio sp. TaxID=2910988 RepID=UPI0027370E11|nr:alkaline phosphatase [Humidesulfovibrio sp.]MDP2847640.1 alkaline phosphatase [Humidesulfovibrio sp.]MDQ7835375.1 alkaline phosphatase [Humidesulfovibrio sp.]